MIKLKECIKLLEEEPKGTLLYAFLELIYQNYYLKLLLERENLKKQLMNDLFTKFEKELNNTIGALADGSMDVDELTYTRAMAEALSVLSEGVEMRLQELENDAI